MIKLHFYHQTFLHDEGVNVGEFLAGRASMLLMGTCYGISSLPRPPILHFLQKICIAYKMLGLGSKFILWSNFSIDCSKIYSKTFIFKSLQFYVYFSTICPHGKLLNMELRHHATRFECTGMAGSYTSLH
jgi:hypothetical protein